MRVVVDAANGVHNFAGNSISRKYLEHALPVNGIEGFGKIHENCA